ncbi:MAG: hypothetical protein CMJ31_04365 [Phycisphaerae bacterium]|nr:hypothetical protein [Phycisphaerae bacterium]
MVGTIVGWIFVSLAAPARMEGAERRGAGAADTGGANALGELLAGHDPDAQQSANRAVREGRAVRLGDVDRDVVIDIAGVPLGAASVTLNSLVAGRVTRSMAAERDGVAWRLTVRPADEIDQLARFRIDVDGEEGDDRPMPLLDADAVRSSDPLIIRIDVKP